MQVQLGTKPIEQVVISNEFKLLVLEQIVEELANGRAVQPEMLVKFRENASQVLKVKYPEMGISLNTHKLY